MGHKIALVGVGASGKTTLGPMVAERLGVPFYELDPIVHGPNWTERSNEAFQEDLAAILSQKGWIVEGLWEFKIGDFILRHANTLVWLDPPLLVVLWRLWWRTVPRIIKRTALWNGNRETWRGAFGGRRSLFGWAIHRHGLLRRTLPQRLTSPEYAHLTLVRLRSSADVRRWIAELPAPALAGPACEGGGGGPPHEPAAAPAANTRPMGGKTMDVQALRAAVDRQGYFHGRVGRLERDDMVAVAAHFGEPYETEESQGHIVSTYVRLATDPLEQEPLEFHNEALYMSRQPVYVFFYCDGSEDFTGRGTALIDSETLLSFLTEDERALAERLSGTIHFSRDVQRPYTLVRRSPATGRPGICYSARIPRARWRIPVPRLLVVEDQAALALLDRIDALCRAHYRQVDWRPGTLLILDNYRVLHARLPVTAGKLVLWRAVCD